MDDPLSGGLLSIRNILPEFLLDIDQAALIYKHQRSEA